MCCRVCPFAPLLALWPSLRAPPPLSHVNFFWGCYNCAALSAMAFALMHGAGQPLQCFDDAGACPWFAVRSSVCEMLSWSTPVTAFCGW